MCIFGIQKKKMKVVEEKKDSLYGTLKVHIKSSEYKPQIDDALKSYKKKINMPGFRSGNVPISLIKNKYGVSIKVEEINKIISKEITTFLEKNKLPIFGYPIPKESKVDWSKDDDYIFEYDLGYKPKFKLSLPTSKNVKYYRIKPDKKQINKNIEDLRLKFGNNVFPEDIKKDDMLYVKIDELIDKKLKNSDEKKLISHNSSLLVSKIEDAKFKKNILKAKKGDVLNFEPKKAFTNDVDLASFLGIEKSNLNDINDKFSCKIDSIKRVELCEINKEFFKKAYPDKQIKNEKELRMELSNNFGEIYKTYSDNKFFKDAIDYIIDKSKISLPDNFLKKWLNHNIEKKMDIDELDKHYDSYKKSFNWELVKEKIMDEEKIEITEDLILQESKSTLSMQFQQYGMVKNDEELDKFANSLLQNKEEKQRIIDQIINKKVIIYLKSKIKIEEKEVTMDDFTKLA